MDRSFPWLQASDGFVSDGTSGYRRHLGPISTRLGRTSQEPDEACRGNAGMQNEVSSNHRPVPRDAGLQNLIHRLLPPVVGKNLDLGIAGKAMRLDRTAHRFDIDHTVAHHAAVI